MKKMILGIVWQLMGFLGSIIILCSAAPVSYTHLDVYKRQPLSFRERQILTAP